MPFNSESRFQFDFMSYKSRLFNGEEEAIKRALQAGKDFGYGNIMAHLARAWAEHLWDDGLPKKTAIDAVSGRGPYPLRPKNKRGELFP